MTQNEMIKNLADKCNVTEEQARTALEVGEWNMLTAAQTLESEKLRRAQELEEVASNCGTATAQAVATEDAASEQAGSTERIEEVDKTATTAKAEGAGRAKAGKRSCAKGLRNLGDHIRRLVACGNRNRFVVRRNGTALLELPVTVMAVLMLLAFWTCVPLMVIGLFLGCRYSFNGRELGREGINGALDKAADAAEHLKGSVAGA